MPDHENDKPLHDAFLTVYQEAEVPSFQRVWAQARQQSDTRQRASWNLIIPAAACLIITALLWLSLQKPVRDHQDMSGRESIASWQAVSDFLLTEASASRNPSTDFLLQIPDSGLLYQVPSLELSLFTNDI
ncbi:MAG: hypothetical protein ACE5GZ_03415 [Gammaproteobacteria bacterium]